MKKQKVVLNRLIQFSFVSALFTGFALAESDPINPSTIVQQEEYKLISRSVSNLYRPDTLYFKSYLTYLTAKNMLKIERQFRSIYLSSKDSDFVTLNEFVAESPLPVEKSRNLFMEFSQDGDRLYLHDFIHLRLNEELNKNLLWHHIGQNIDSIKPLSFDEWSSYPLDFKSINSVDALELTQKQLTYLVKIENILIKNDKIKAHLGNIAELREKLKTVEEDKSNKIKKIRRRIKNNSLSIDRLRKKSDRLKKEVTKASDSDLVVILNNQLVKESYLKAKLLKAIDNKHLEEISDTEEKIKKLNAIALEVENNISQDYPWLERHALSESDIARRSDFINKNFSLVESGLKWSERKSARIKRSQAIWNYLNPSLRENIPSFHLADTNQDGKVLLNEYLLYVSYPFFIKTEFDFHAINKKSDNHLDSRERMGRISSLPLSFNIREFYDFRREDFERNLQSLAWDFKEKDLDKNNWLSIDEFYAKEELLYSLQSFKNTSIKLEILKRFGWADLMLNLINYRKRVHYYSAWQPSFDLYPESNWYNLVFKK